MSTREDAHPVEGEGNHTTTTSTAQDNHEENGTATAPQLTDEEAARKWEEAKALFNEDKYAEAADIFADLFLWVHVSYWATEIASSQINFDKMVAQLCQ